MKDNRLPFFIHIPRTGGSVIKKYLTHPFESEENADIGFMSATTQIHQLVPLKLRHQTIRDSFSRQKIKYRRSVFVHARIQDIQFDENVFKKFKFFSIVRNPWAREVSKYQYLMNDLYWVETNEWQRTKRKSFFDMFGRINFDEYLDMRDDFFTEYAWLHAYENSYPQMTYIEKPVEFENQFSVDILRTEHLVTELPKYLKRDCSFLKEYKSDYKSYYDERRKKLVASYYEEDIEHFGFTFESSATKNCYYEG